MTEITSGLPCTSGRFVTVDGARLFVMEAGAGEPVLLLHGYPQSHLAWRHQIPSLAGTHRVIAPDWFGWGRSERGLRHPARYWDEVARIVRLLDTLGLGAVSIAGHDYGGFLSLGFALRYPDRVRRLAVLNSRAHRTFPQPAYALFGVLAWAARRRALRSLAARAPHYAINRALMAGHVARGVFDEAQRDRYIGWMRTRAGRRWLIHFMRYYEMPARADLAPHLGAIDCPAAMIWGDRDPYCPASIGKDLAARLPAGRFVRVAGADHFVMEERPDEVTGALRSLLARPAGHAGRAHDDPG